MSVDVPVTIWQPTNGLSEIGDEGEHYVVDPSAFYLVDTAGFYVTDTGVMDNLIPATIWTEDDSV